MDVGSYLIWKLSFTRSVNLYVWEYTSKSYKMQEECGIISILFLAWFYF
jgi:hypothetical protein